MKKFLISLSALVLLGSITAYADIAVTPGAGKTVATETTASREFQQVSVSTLNTMNASGIPTPVSYVAPVPVQSTGTSTVQLTGTASANVSQVGGNAVQTNGLGIQRVSSAIDGSSNTVTANAGTNLNTSLLAVESGGNLATLAGGLTSSVYQSNLKNVGGNGVQTNGLGIQRVSSAIDGSSNTVVANAGTGTFNIQANASVNHAQVNGNGVQTNGLGIQRVSSAIDGSSNTVTANAGTGTFNIQANASVNVAQINGNTPQTNGLGILRVSGSIDGSSNTIQGGLSNNGAAAATNRLATLPGVVQTDYANGSAYTQGRDAAPNIDTVGNLWTSPQPGMRPASYNASFSSATYASTTDLACIPGNASNTVIVRRITVSCTQTTAGQVTFSIIRRSAADSGGTSANITVGKDDSTSASAVSVPVVYSAAPTRGAQDSLVASFTIGCMASATASPNDVWIENWNDKAKVLRGTAQEFCLSLAAPIDGAGVTVTGGTVNGHFEWNETKTVTP